MPKYIMAHDLGTSGNKATLYTVDGELVGSVVSRYETFYKQERWAEQDPEHWWKAVCDSSKMLMENHDKNDLVAISFSGQMMGCLCLDKNGNPLTNSIIWADTRSYKECEELNERFGSERICSIIGQQLSPNFALTKLMWVKKNLPDVYKNTALSVQAKDYIAWKMTGRHVTEQTDAAFYQAFDVGENHWSWDLIEAAGIRDDIFPEVIDCADVVGEVTKDAAEALGIKAGIPVVAGAGDGPASSLGAGAVRAGIAFLTMGSTCGLAAITDTFSPDSQGRLNMGPHVVKGLFGVGGAMQNGGVSYEWIRSKLFGEGISYREMDAFAKKSPAGANGVMFLPYLLGERAPWWNPLARASFIGMGFDTNRGDMLRAVLEGVGYNLELIHRIISKYAPIDTMIMTGGGAKSELWSSIIADILGVPIKRPIGAEEATSFGAALIAGVGIGLYKDYTVALDMMKFRGEDIVPNEENHRFYQQKVDLFEKAYYAVQPIIDGLKE